MMSEEVDKAPLEHDLEDGEIDDDDDNDDTIVVVDPKIVGTAPILPNGISKSLQFPPIQINEPNKEIGLAPIAKSKSKKNQLVDDDFAGSIESAIAAALKKDGIMPTIPKILQSREEIDKNPDKESVLSKRGRRRKRRKLRDEREKEKKKRRISTPDPCHKPILIDDHVDDDEMLCVRGGSPQANEALPLFSPLNPSILSKKQSYDSEDSYTSYDSYESGNNYSRYSSTRKKDSNSLSSRLKRIDRSRQDEERHEKRSRRNYDDSGGEERHPQQPRKLELCKFYLMECCAKKDKCSYMHSDFPCKYYYLGMECVFRSACKFSHGKPLSEQLRNVLLKHLETAPKEILGTFRRISRENAINLINSAHEKICEKHGVENTIVPATQTIHALTPTKAGEIRNGEVPLQKISQQQQSEVIPSLLDIVIKIPPNSTETVMPTTSSSTSTAGTVRYNNQNTAKSEKRKSRWCDSNTINPCLTKHNNLEPPSSNAPSYLDLKNLTGILSTERIEKLSKCGVVNLEQINQLTLSQLNKIGLTITEISEIQLNARNMAKLGVVGVVESVNSTNILSATKVVTLPRSITSSQDVDMRFFPSCLPKTTTTITSSTSNSGKYVSEIGLDSPEPQSFPTEIAGVGPIIREVHCESTGLGSIDYSQYLRDSNLGYEKNDLMDDEKDEEQLVIDDQNLEALDETYENNTLKVNVYVYVSSMVIGQQKRKLN